MKSWTSRPLPTLPGTGEPPRVYDTAAKSMVTLPAGQSASMYVCGITPYDSTHLGHAATYLAFDVLQRLWRDAGTEVAYVQNVTDVDDPLLERADRDGVDWQDLAAGQIELFHADMEALNVLAPDHYVGAVEAVDWIIPTVAQYLKDGTAYRLDGDFPDIYFDVQAASAKPDDADPLAWRLGQVSGLSEEDMLPLFAERGGDPDRLGKRHCLDPLLWRAARDGEPSWDGGELGQGRPGWHIECTVIARKLLPAPFTVQGGGSDLSFPHHEMGAGHAWAENHVALAEHYMYAGMVGLDGEKMSKSRGNLVFVSKLRQSGVDPAVIRAVVLAHHYRSDWFYSDAELATATERISTWRAALGSAPEGSGEALLSQLRSLLVDDLNTPDALAAVDDWAAQATEQASTTSSSEDSALVKDAIEALLGIRL